MSGEGIFLFPFSFLYRLPTSGIRAATQAFKNVFQTVFPPNKKLKNFKQKVPLQSQITLFNQSQQLNLTTQILVKRFNINPTYINETPHKSIELLLLQKHMEKSDKSNFKICEKNTNGMQGTFSFKLEG